VVGREETMCRCRRESGDRLELGTSKLCERANRRRGRVNHATTMREMRLEMGRRGVDEKSRARRLRRDEEMVMMVMGSGGGVGARSSSLSLLSAESIEHRPCTMMMKRHGIY
jgi:hypothetical protein